MYIFPAVTLGMEDRTFFIILPSPLEMFGNVLRPFFNVIGTGKYCWQLVPWPSVPIRNTGLEGELTLRMKDIAKAYVEPENK